MEKRPLEKRLEEYAAALAKARINKAQIKFAATHELIEQFTPTHPRTGQPHTRLVKNEDGKMVRELVLVNRYRFTGHNYGKKYTGAKLRELEAKRNAEALA